MVDMSAEYLGELHCALAHGPSGATVETDAPTDNAGRGAAFSPTDLVGAALLSCALTTMAIKAPNEGIVFGVAKGRVKKLMTASPPRRIAKLVVEIDMPAGIALADRERIEKIGRECPVALSLSGDVNAPITFSYPD